MIDLWGKEFVPPLLCLLLHNLISDEVKQISFGHALIQASRPHSILAPVLFGLCVSLDHLLASKWLLVTLSRLGFSVSPKEVNHYKPSVVQIPDIDLPSEYPHSFTQWSADNVDHNVITLNGLGAFHGMGIISMSINCNNGESNEQGVETGVKRLSRVKVIKLNSGQAIPILTYTSLLTLTKFRSIGDL